MKKDLSHFYNMDKTDIMKVTFQENNLLIGKNHLSGVCDILAPLHCPLLAEKYFFKWNITEYCTFLNGPISEPLTLHLYSLGNYR